MFEEELLFASKESFLRQYKGHCFRKRERLYITVLNCLCEVISTGDDVDRFMRLSDVIDHINCLEDSVALKKYYNNSENLLNRTNLVILACESGNSQILNCIFDNDNNLLKNVSLCVGRSAVSPKDTDAFCHNAFYYAIRSNNVDLLHTLIKKWPNNYFNSHSAELDEVLSQAYEELNLINIPLEGEMKDLVLKTLLDLRFYSDESKPDEKHPVSIGDRISMLLNSIDFIQVNGNDGMVDSKFLFIAKFIAKAINVLKRQLKPTYEWIPWEEMEFCLICFISAHLKQQEINLFYLSTFNKAKILSFLKYFAIILNDERDKILSTIHKLSNCLPKKKREKIISEILTNHPEVKELYTDYQQVRDIYSLSKMSEVMASVSSVNPSDEEGQLVITRSLQVLGENVKNTLESPKLSNRMCDLLLISLSSNTRQVIINLRDSLSHSSSLIGRMEIEKMNDVNFFVGVKNDIGKLFGLIRSIMHKNRIKIVTSLLYQIVKYPSFKEVKKICDIIQYVKLEKVKLSSLSELERIQSLTENLNGMITNKTSSEIALINEAFHIIENYKEVTEKMENDYTKAFTLLQSMYEFGDGYNEQDLRIFLMNAQGTHANMNRKSDIKSIDKIVDLIVSVSRSVKARTENYNFDTIDETVMKICIFAKFKTDDLTGIEQLRDQLNAKSLYSKHKSKSRAILSEEDCARLLGSKLTLLRKSSQKGHWIKNLVFENELERSAVVKLLLDIFSILGEMGVLAYVKSQCIDHNVPLITGKYLRNYLAHHDPIYEILPCEPEAFIILNARKLLEEDILSSKRKIGTSLTYDTLNVSENYQHNIILLNEQEIMFSTVIKGNIEQLKDISKNGTDLHGRTINSSTTLHEAAKGGNLDVFHFLLDRNINVFERDEKGRSPIHISSGFGRHHITSELIRVAGVKSYVSVVDNDGNTPLHLAAKSGDANTVNVLLENGANTKVLTNLRASPLFLAVNNNHLEVTKTLLLYETQVDLHSCLDGTTLLMVAAERGHSQIVQHLLSIGAYVDAKDDKNLTPIILGAIYGNNDVVEMLIRHNADVNATDMEGKTALVFAAMMGHGKTLEILLMHGADVAIAGSLNQNEPLHYASRIGHEKIVTALLERMANVNASNVEGLTPLMYAAQGGHFNVARILVERGANMHSVDNNNFTPLHHAIRNGHKELVEYFLHNGSTVNAKCDEPLRLEEELSEYDFEENTLSAKKYKCKKIIPLIHIAALGDCVDVIDILLKNKIDVNAKNEAGVTALHISTLRGIENNVNFLLNNGADVEAKLFGSSTTPLHSAISEGHGNIVRLLIQSGAQTCDETNMHNALLAAIEAGYIDVVEFLISGNVYPYDKVITDRTLLFTAIRHNQKEIVKFLVDNKYYVPDMDSMNDGLDQTSLAMAAVVGYKDIVNMLLTSNFSVNYALSGGFTPLHLASGRGNISIVNALIAKGASIDAKTSSGATPLSVASQQGREEIVRRLLEMGADVNLANSEGTAMLAAARKGFRNIVEWLLKYKGDPNIKDQNNRTPLEQAVAHGHIGVTEMLLNIEGLDINAKGYEGGTLLHLAVQKNDVDMVKLLVDNGANIHAKNDHGTLPIHLAAREGFEESVAFFLNNGSSVNETDCYGHSLLHYAAVKNQSGILDYLIVRGADVNAKGLNLRTPLHVAALFNCPDFAKSLLSHGCVYNAYDKFGSQPIHLTKLQALIDSLTATDELFLTVKADQSSIITKCIKAGAHINATNTDGFTPLHFASWKGNYEIAKVLLKNGANPNAVGKKATTPLHYAAKFSHFGIVKLLLSNGAIYNSISESGKIPYHFASAEEIRSLLDLIAISFNRIKDKQISIINDLGKITDIDHMRSVMNAQNEKNQTLIVFAIHSKFPKVQQLKQLFQKDIARTLNAAIELLYRDDYNKGLNILRAALETRKAIFGRDNPGTLDIQYIIAEALHNQGKWREALSILESIVSRQQRLLGLQDESTLKTRGMIALLLFRMGKAEESLKLFEEVYQAQIEQLGPYHLDVMKVRFNMGLAFIDAEKYAEASEIFIRNHAFFKENFGPDDLNAINSRENIAWTLSCQGKFKESREIFEETFQQKKRICGLQHAETLKTLMSVGNSSLHLKDCDRALAIFTHVLELQQNILHRNHPELLTTLYQIASALYSQFKMISAFKAYKEFLDLGKHVLGPNDPFVVDASNKVEAILSNYKTYSFELNDLLLNLQVCMNTAASRGDVRTVSRLINDGININDGDSEGRTALHFAASHGRIDIVNFLLENGADATRVTNEGNTPLHIATAKCDEETVYALLNHINPEERVNFVNWKTITSGSTALHIAAKCGNFNIVKSLLRNGAIYECENLKGEKAVDVANDQHVSILLKQVKKFFKASKNEDVNVIAEMEDVEADEFFAITGARDNQGLTMLQGAIINKLKNVSGQLGDLLTFFMKNKSTV